MADTTIFWDGYLGAGTRSTGGEGALLAPSMDVPNKTFTVSISYPGSGYRVPPTITCTAAPPGGTTGIFTCTVSPSGGGITAIQTIQAPAGYLAVPDLEVIPARELDPRAKGWLRGYGGPAATRVLDGPDPDPQNSRAGDAPAILAITVNPPETRDLIIQYRQAVRLAGLSAEVKVSGEVVRIASQSSPRRTPWLVVLRLVDPIPLLHIGPDGLAVPTPDVVVNLPAGFVTGRGARGVVRAVSVTSGGTGYLAATADVQGSGTGASLLANISGTSVSTIEVLAGGSGYTAGDPVVIAGSGSSGQAVATITTGLSSQPSPAAVGEPVTFSPALSLHGILLQDVYGVHDAPLWVIAATYGDRLTAGDSRAGSRALKDWRAINVSTKISPLPGGVSEETIARAAGDLCYFSVTYKGASLGNLVGKVASGTIGAGQGLKVLPQALESVTVPGQGTPTAWMVSTSEECLPLGGGGSGSLVATILGGNVDPSTPPDPTKKNDASYLKGKINRAPAGLGSTYADELGFLDTDYPTSRPYAFPLPILNVEKAKQALPLVNRWDAYWPLPESYRFGDKLPRLPDGLCYVRLARPYSWNGSAWDANLSTPPGTTGALVGVSVTVKADSGSTTSQTLTVTWTRSDSVTVGDWNQSDLGEDIPASEAFSLPGSFLRDPGTGTYLSVASYTHAAGITTLTLSSAQPVGDLAGKTLLVQAGVLLIADPQNPATALPSPIQTLTIAVTGDRGTVALACNRSGLQGFTAGDHVVMADTKLEITDHSSLVPSQDGGAGTDRTLPVLELISGAGGPLPLHTHTNAGGGLSGGGVSTYSPTSF